MVFLLLRAASQVLSQKEKKGLLCHVFLYACSGEVAMVKGMYPKNWIALILNMQIGQG